MEWPRMPRQPMVGLGICAATGILLAELGRASFVFSPSSLALLLTASVLAFLSLLWRLRTSGAVMCLTLSAFFALHLLDSKWGPGFLLGRVLANSKCPVQAQGVVSSEPDLLPSGRMGERSRFELDLEQLRVDERLYFLPAPVLVDWLGKPPSRGDRVEFVAETRGFLPPRNPGQFDQPAYFNRRGIFNELRVRFPSDAKILGSGNGNRLLAAADRSRHWMQQKLRIDLEDSPQIAGLIQSLVLGLKEETPETTRELFQRTGTMHLFVVNGLHVGLFASIIWHLLKPLGLNRRRAVFVMVPLLGFYALVTGLSPGSIRATIMAAVVLGGNLADRRPLSLNSLAAAAFAILLCDTRQLFQPGFQFSFGVVSSIILLAPRFRRYFSQFGQPDPFLPRVLWSWRQVATASILRGLAALAAVSLAAWIGSLPFTLGYLHLLTPSAFLANLLIVPVAFAILGQGVLCIAVAVFSPFMAALFSNANWATAHLLLGIVRLFVSVPGSHLYLEPPRLRPPLVELTVFDFGRGGAIHLRCEGHDWLLDCANSAQFKATVRAYLRSRGVNRLDGLLLSHGHIANIGGTLDAIDSFQPRLIVDSPLRDRSGFRNSLQNTLDQRSQPKCILARGDTLRISPSTTLRVLYPPAGIETRSADDRCLVVQLQIALPIRKGEAPVEPNKKRPAKTWEREAPSEPADGFSKSLAGQEPSSPNNSNESVTVLFLFDSGYPTEQWLLENEPDLHCDLLVKGMHAEELSGTSIFVNAASPRLLVCGSGGNAGFSRISEEWIAEIQSLPNAPEIIRQDQTGAVRIEITKEGAISARPQLR